ncbi:MAG: alpha-1,4-glucan--maltose-1-phosphate maltosyltransferase [Bacteroidia bacterium]
MAKSPKITLPGKARAIIHKIGPSVDGGRFAVKRVVGDRLDLWADLLIDGHDKVNACVLYRKKGARKWEEAPMHQEAGERWTGNISLVKPGFYEYAVEAWVDHAISWNYDTRRKIEGWQRVQVELQMGAAFLEAILPKATKKEQAEINKWINILLDEKQYEKAISLVLDGSFVPVFLKYPARENPTQSTALPLWVDREKAVFSAWYELFPRSTSAKPGKHGTFKDTIRLLPRLQDLGMDTLYLPPIHPIGVQHRKGKNNSTTALPEEPGCPWAIGGTAGGHKVILPELGSLDDFRLLVKEAQAVGIEIALDYALQCSPDHPYVKEHPQWFKWRPDGTVQYAENPPKKYQDVLPINFETEDWENLWYELRSILEFWIAQGVKIFRVDNPHTKSFQFWEWCIAGIHEKNPEVLFLSEAFTAPSVMKYLAKAGFTQSYTYYSWRNTKHELIQYLEELSNTEMAEYFRPNFWPNTPDINPIPLQGAKDALFLTRYFMAATLSSNYGFYGPVYEFMISEPMPGKEEYIDSEKYEVRHWDWSKTNKLTELIRRTNKARRENKALQRTNNIHFCQVENDQLLAYLKMSDDRSNAVLAIVNLDQHDTQRGMVQLPLYMLGFGPDAQYQVYDLITGARYSWQGEWNYVELNPEYLPVHLFRIEKF